MAAEKIVTESALSALASDVKRAIYDILPSDTASGDIATFETDLELPLKSAVCNINATQSGTGTPSPSNPRAISGFSSLDITRCGVNLFDISAYDVSSSDIQCTLNADGSLTVTNTGASAGSINWVYTKKLPNGTYTIKNLSESAFYLQLAEGDYSHNIAVNGSYTFTYDGSGYMRIVPGNLAANTTKTFKIQIESGSAFTTYAAYNGTTKHIDFEV